MKNYRQTMESWPYKNFQLWEYYFKNININELLIRRIYAYLEWGILKPEYIQKRKENGIIYKIHKISNSGYRLIEIDIEKNKEDIWDWINYIKSYPAIWHGIIAWKNKVYFIVSHSQESSLYEYENIMNNIQSIIKDIKIPE